MKHAAEKTHWVSTLAALPPKGSVVNTKIDDCKGVRNVDTLLWDGKMWWTPDGNMYIYYTPTHWQYI